MSKVKTTTWGLKFGHPTAYRRTIKIYEGTGKNRKEVERYQLVFEPNTPADLSDVEVEACQDLIDGGLLEPWHSDPKGRRARPNQVARIVESNRVQELELDNAALEEQVALLIEQVKELGAVPVVEAVEETTEIDPPADDAAKDTGKKGNKNGKGAKAPADDAAAK